MPSDPLALLFGANSLRYAHAVEAIGISPTYFYFDGDDVGAGIELALLRDEPATAAKMSARVLEAVAFLSSTLRDEHSAEIVFAGGDEVLAVTKDPLTAEALEALRADFEHRSGLTISCGWAASARQATLNLRVAKLRGKNQAQGVST